MESITLIDPLGVGLGEACFLRACTCCLPHRFEATLCFTLQCKVGMGLFLTTDLRFQHLQTAHHILRYSLFIMFFSDAGF